MSRALVLTGRLLRAAAGLAVMAALLIGLPWGLARATGSPLPRTWPGWQQVQGFFTSPLADGAIIRVLADAAWLLWAVLAVSLIIEVAAAIRGQPAPRLPAIAPVQALAAALVGATLMTVLHAPRPAPRGTQPLHAALTSATTISAPLLPGQPAHPATNATTAGRAAASSGSANAARPRVYRVQEGDDLWAISQRHLGNGEDWHQIYQLNKDRPQPDGGALTDPDLIRPGWVLLIPQPGDPKPGNAHQDPAPASSSAPRAPAVSHPADPPAPPSPQASPSARPSVSTRPSAGASQPARPSGPAAHGRAPSHAAHPGKSPVRLPSGALIGFSVALMVAAALALAAIQRRRRYRPRPGLTGSLQPDAQPLPDVISALRRAARPAPPAEETGPEEAGPGTADASGEDPYFDLYETAAEPDHGVDQGVPALEPDDEPQAQREERPGQAGQAPGGIPLGVVGDGSEAAVNVASLGGLGLTGPGARSAARAILATLLAQAPPAETGLPAVIIPAADAVRLLPGTDPASIPGVSVPATIEAALGELESCLLTLDRTSGADDDPEDARPEPDEGSLAPVLIAEVGQGSTRRLEGILETGRRTGVTAIMLGTWDAGVTCDVAADGTVEAAGPQTPDLDGFQLYTLGSAEAAGIVGVLQEADGSLPAAPHSAEPDLAGGDGRGRPRAVQPPQEDGQHLPAFEAPALPAPAAEPVPGPPASPDPARESHDGEPPAPGERPVQLSVLGPLCITVGGQEVSGGLRKARELLAYLAVHPGGASGEAIAEALWPDADPGRTTGQRNLALRKAREMLRAATGLTAPMWILNASGRYRLDSALIATDYQAFGDALDTARQAAGEAKLAACREAVALYRGELADGEGYEWAEPYAETARRRALDAWTAIAEILQPDDPDQALSALEAALAHDPYNEYLYQRIMRLQADAGRPEAVRRTLRLLEARLDDIDVAPSSRTRQFAASLLGGSSPARRPEPERLPRT